MVVVAVGVLGNSRGRVSVQSGVVVVVPRVCTGWVKGLLVWVPMYIIHYPVRDKVIDHDRSTRTPRCKSHHVKREIRQKGRKRNKPRPSLTTWRTRA